MEPETTKRALTREETKELLSLIEGSKIINNKKTNAATNRMKIDEWERIANALNATVSICRRTPQQLRMKWENLKKNSRKRSTQIRMARLRTGGGPPAYFPPDDILDRVLAMLGSTGEGLAVSLGGDAVPNIDENTDVDGGGDGVGDGGGDGVGDGGGDGVGDGFDEDHSLPMSIENVPSTSMLTGNGKMLWDGVHATNTTQHIKRSGVKRKFKKVDATTARNSAIAGYFNAKKKYIESKMQNIEKDYENERIKIELERIKLENYKLSLENENLKLEILQQKKN